LSRNVLPLMLSGLPWMYAPPASALPALLTFASSVESSMRVNEASL
jgi:hypothetical protein